jgi:predicted GIY-YIG superfamily endonuclease
MLIKKLFSDASQASLAVSYRDIRIKIHTKIADIQFNKECIRKKITPQYAQIKMNCNSIAARKTKEQAEALYVENMIKQLYREKDELNAESYNIHLEFLKTYGYVAWHFLSEVVSEEMEKVMEHKYARIHTKLENLKKKNSKDEELEENESQHQFQERVINLTEVQFEEEETRILDFGLKHNFTVNTKTETDQLATDIESNIRRLKDIDHNAVRREITTSITNRGLHRPNKEKKEELKTCIGIKKKLEENNSIAVKADKSNAIVIMGKEDYIKKTEEFIKENNFKELPRDPTERYQKELTDIVKKCPKVIPEDCRLKMNINNSKAPVMKGIPKIHKKNVPIRPLVNFQPAPTYNISKLLSKRLSQDLELEYKYTVKNCYDFVEKAKNVSITSNSRLVSFDISNLYTNIPVNETVELIECRLMNNGLDRIYVNQIVKLLKIVLKQNYFRFNGRFYEQTNGLAMGSPLSGILSEVFLQYNEEILLEKLKRSHEVELYTRYVDDILIIYKETEKDEKEKMMKLFNDHHSHLTFTNEYEENKKISFLDLTVLRRENKLEFDIYRKPTQTNTTINNKSIHPNSHKFAAFRSMIYRAHKIPLSEENRKKEIKLIKKIAQANGFQPMIIDEIGAKIIRQIRNQERIRKVTTLDGRIEENTKYAAFNFNGNRTQKIANKFKKYGVSVAFKTQNNMSRILHPKIEDSNKYNSSGIYKINCNDCEKFYIGQTVNFGKRYKNHASAWRNNKPERSNVAKHLLENDHTLGKIEENMEIIKNCKKGYIMDAWEELFIYKEKCQDRKKLINEQVNFDSGGTFKNLLPATNQRPIDQPEANFRSQ